MAPMENKISLSWAMLAAFAVAALGLGAFFAVSILLPERAAPMPSPVSAAPERSGPLTESERTQILAEAPRVEPGRELSASEIEAYLKRLAPAEAALSESERALAREGAPKSEN